MPKEDHNFYHGCIEGIAEADRRQDLRPTEKLMIGGIRTRALVDLGATFSAMAATLFRRIPASEIISREYSPRLRVTAASNQKMSLVGVYTIRMSSEKLGIIQWPMAIMESMASAVILGVDFLSQFEAMIQVKRQEVQYAAIPRTGSVRAQTAMKVRWHHTVGRESHEEPQRTVEEDSVSPSPETMQSWQEYRNGGPRTAPTKSS
jgi:hypothetical protein